MEFIRKRLNKDTIPHHSPKFTVAPSKSKTVSINPHVTSNNNNKDHETPRPEIPGFHIYDSMMIDDPFKMEDNRSQSMKPSTELQPISTKNIESKSNVEYVEDIDNIVISPLHEGDDDAVDIEQVQHPLYHTNAKVWVLSKNTSLWRECIIRESNDHQQIRIHFISFSSFYDEWIDINSERIQSQRPDGNELHIGDNFSFYAKEWRAWLEAEVTAVDIQNDKIQVMLIAPGKLDKMWLSKSSPLISITHKKVNDPAPNMVIRK